MISKATIKFIHSLEHKKFRMLEGAFLVEGHKSIHDMLCAGWKPRLIIATDEWSAPVNCSCEVIRVTPAELQRTSLLQHPSQALAVFSIPTSPTPSLPAGEGVEITEPKGNITLPPGRETPSGQRGCSNSSLFTLHSPLLALDGVQDPGNLGTIIRTADWFGITDIVCSTDTVDAYNPKVVQATMGSLARVRIHYTDLPAFLRSLPQGTHVYGTLLDGKDIYSEPLSAGGVIIMGNEGNGISEEVRQLVTHKLLIPHFSDPHPESLNVSVATAITLSEFRRRVKKS